VHIVQKSPTLKTSLGKRTPLPATWDLEALLEIKPANQRALISDRRDVLMELTHRNCTQHAGTRMFGSGPRGGGFIPRFLVDAYIFVEDVYCSQ